jgi:toll-like receptor 13
MLNLEDLRCQGPQNVQNKLVSELVLTISDCEDPWIKMLVPLAAIFGGIFLIWLCFVIVRNRWHLRYLLFLARAGLGHYQELVDDQEYLYDAFVAYSSEDLEWVKQKLLPNVDENYLGKTGLKLCIHHRDWLAGIDIADNIVKSIAESRRTILVLSKDFAKSYWCRLELAIAHMRLDIESYKKDRLVIILLGDLLPEHLTPRVKHILTTKSYLSWPDNPADEQCFWRAVRKSLRKGLLYHQRDDRDQTAV